MRKTAGWIAAAALAASLLTAGSALGGSDPDGSYKGNVVGSPTVKVTHRIKDDGRKLSKFRTTISAVCVVGTSIVIEPVLVGLGTVHIQKDGSFKGRYKPNGKYDLKYDGQLNSKKAKAGGHVEGKINNCTIKFDWKTKKT
jgi:hypothetical protein